LTACEAHLTSVKGKPRIINPSLPHSREAVKNPFTIKAYITSLTATGVFLLALLLFWQRLKYRAVQRENGCQPPSQYPHKDPFFGIDLFLRLGKAVVENCQLKLSQQLHQETWQNVCVELVGIWGDPFY
jgi:hypothetical protein